MQLDDFLSLNPVAHDIEPGSPGGQRDAGATVDLLALIVSQSDRHLRILHLGTDYLIDKGDVVSVSTPALIFGSFGRAGRAAKIEVRADAIIRPAGATTAAQFLSTLPFAFLVPSWADSVDRRAFNSERDVAWLRERGLLTPAAHDGTRPLTAAESGMTDMDTPGHEVTTYSGTAVGTMPDVYVKPGDDDDRETTPTQTNDYKKNDDGY